jgi:hypothetical protein
VFWMYLCTWDTCELLYGAVHRASGTRIKVISHRYAQWDLVFEEEDMCENAAREAGGHGGCDEGCCEVEARDALRCCY